MRDRGPRPVPATIAALLHGTNAVLTIARAALNLLSTGALGWLDAATGGATHRLIEGVGPFVGVAPGGLPMPMLGGAALVPFLLAGSLVVAVLFTAFQLVIARRVWRGRGYIASLWLGIAVAFVSIGSLPAFLLGAVAALTTWLARDWLID